jgi:hypothetical protein
MAKILKCGDVVLGCKEVIKGDSEHDVTQSCGTRKDGPSYGKYSVRRFVEGEGRDP